MKFDDKLMKVNVKTTRSGSVTIFEAHGEVFKKISGVIIARVTAYETVDDKLMHLVNVTSNVCYTWKRLLAHPVVRYIVVRLMKASRIPTVCPIKKVRQPCGKKMK